LGDRGIGMPLLWMIAFIVVSFPLFLSLLKKHKPISIPIVFWCGVYLAFPSISILILPKIPNLQYLENQIRTVIFLLLMLVIFSYHPLVSKWVKLTISLVTFINIGMFIYEFFHPFAFYLEPVAPGRSSGFYEDANTAAITVILSMIFTIDWFKPKYRIFYVLFILLGIAPTFSRGGIVGWFLVVLVFMVTKVIPRHQISFLFLSIFILISILSTQINNLKYIKTADGTKLFTENTITRVEFLIDPFGQKDKSSDTRLDILDESWQRFTRQPFIGQGLGSGESDSMAAVQMEGVGERSHNMYLDKMLEYGFLGALLYPWLIFASVWKVEGEFKKQAIAFVIFLLSQGIFTHTLLSEFCSLSVYAIMANFTQHSYTNHQSKLRNV
ncbi:MAG: O-antigen ligase family protein, partial [Waterburya sp.]